MTRSPPHLRARSSDVFDLFGSDLAQALVEDVAGMFEIDREGQDVRAPSGIGFVEPVLTPDPREIELDGLVQPIQPVIQLADRGRALRSSWRSASARSRSMASTMSAMRKVSREASARATPGVARAPRRCSAARRDR